MFFLGNTISHLLLDNRHSTVSAAHAAVHTHTTADFGAAISIKKRTGVAGPECWH